MRHYYKLIALLLIIYSLTAGLLMDVPSLPVLNESIRMLYVHVPLWFGMVLLYSLSVYYAICYTRSGAMKQDNLSYSYAEVGFWYSLLGMITGMIWAKYTWGEAWSSDPKQNAAALSMLIYTAYFILRNSIPDPQRRARTASLYNLFGYALMLPLIFVLPRLTDSLHPGSGGNPGFNTYDLDSSMRWVFYPAVIGWTIFGVWIAKLKAELLHLEQQLRHRERTTTTKKKVTQTCL